MREFRRDELRDQQPLEGDALHTRWRAQHARAGQVILLALRPEHASRPEVRAAWLDLAARNAACVSPGLLAVVDHGVADGAVLLAREHAPDALPLSTLLEHLEGRGETVPLLLAVHVVRMLCETLRDAHGLIVDGLARPLHHGDLAAERVLVRADGRLQLTELGLHAVLAPPRSADAHARVHLAPELDDELPMSARADLYALGALLKRMLVPGAGKKSGATRALVPVLPPHDTVQLIGKLTARSPSDRPSGVAALQRELAAHPAHGAGAAVLAQLHEDVRARAARLLVGSTPGSMPRAIGGEPVAQSATRASQRTAMFIAPSAAASRVEAARPREAAGGFRGRTQVFGAPMRPVGAADAPPPAAAPVPAGSTADAQGTDLTAHAPPPMLNVPRVAPPAAAREEGMPPLLSRLDAAPLDPRMTTSRLDLHEMPPLLAHVQSPRTAADADAQRTPSAYVRAPDAGIAAREVTPAAVAQAEQTARPRYSEVGAVSAQRPTPAPSAYEEPKRESGLRLSSSSRAAQGEAAPLALPEPALGLEPVARAPQARKREPWRDASETVFKMKVPALAANMAPRARTSPVVMFVVAMLVATLLIVGIRLLVGLIA